ncbi:class I SAM-dependent DNA methyltransferase [Variovorax sp. KK3]|uniref:type I restriction-modification system subunit M n=1 Tax=Variovorax sp. KK3 TaxID=1855728 RepID=UPI00097C12B5|nr:class I SAM-dependent DNA methyltransferase [Variovorax sp. KK3]
MNPTANSRSSIDAALSAACDTIRGVVDAATCRDYILPLLFLKYVSDAWQDHRDGYHAQYGEGAADLIEALLKTERFILPPGASFEALHAARFDPGNGERIDRALRAIEDANIAKLRDVFQDIGFNSNRLGGEQQKNGLLRLLLEAFASPGLDLRPSRIGGPEPIGIAFESIIGHFASASGRSAGDACTPPEVARLMACLMAPQAGDDICDPMCGAGSLLIQCARVIRERSGTRHYALFGQESIGNTWALAKMNLFMHGEDNHRIEWGDTLRNPRLLAGDGTLRRYDVVVGHPPFSQEKWGHDVAETDGFGRFRRGLPPRTKADYAFILHMVETLKPGSGRMAVLVSHGVLFRGAGEARLRKKLVEDQLLDAVIGLPEKLFHGTGIPAAILVFRSRKQDDKVLFIDASGDFEPGKNQNTFREADIQRVLRACESRRSVGGYAYLASAAEIARNDFNLNLPRYVNAVERRCEIDMVEMQRERERLKQEWREVEAQMAGYLAQLGHNEPGP